MDSTIEISIILPTYNRGPILEKALARLVAQTVDRCNYEIIVADDGSQDNTPEVVAAAALKADVRHLRFESRCGLPRIRNEAIRQAKGRYLLFTDSDVLVRPDFVEAHLKAHRQHPGAIINGVLVNIACPEEAGKPRSLWDINCNPFDTANASCSAEAVVAVGGFEENFAAYGWQDVELGYRLQKYGLKNYRCRQALAYHVRGPASIPNLDFMREKSYMRGRSGAKFYLKHPEFSVKLAVHGNPLFLLSGLGGWLENHRAGRRLLQWSQSRNGLIRDVFRELVVAYHYERGYNEERFKR